MHILTSGANASVQDVIMEVKSGCDLDVGTMMEEAKARWLRPNEIHAILCNFKYFSINVKPLNLPKSGKIVLFDRKMLRNFRKDGHNWKKKKDGKTVKEAHEHLKVGNEERIHVYYAHGQDNPTFVRRCYWLLDKTLEHIVLVHYRETQEGSPVTPVNSSSSSGLSDPSASWLLSEETDSGTNQVYSTEPGDSITIKIHERRLHEINTLEWEDLLVPDDPSKLNTSEGGGNASCFEQQNQYEINGCKSKIMVIGQFYEGYPDLRKSNLFCVCGDAFAPAEIVQPGVFRCLVSPHTPGPVNLYLSFDGRKPISQVMTFEYRVPFLQNQMGSSEDKSKWEEFQVQMRLARLLFSTSNSLKILSSKVSQNSLQQAKVFARRSSQIFDSWANMIKSIENKKIPFPQAKDSLFELSLKSKLQEWLLERVIDGCKTSDHDDHGQGVIHLCAILGYTWAVYSYSWSGLSIDYRDKFGWTALHWAAYCGRKEMVAALLSAGAKPNLVTDPTKENPGGCNAADLASKNGFDGLAAYLAEKALVQHFEDMTIAGNVSGSLQTSTTNSVEPGNLSEDDLYLKDTLTAYRTAVDAAARIHAAFREHSFKLREKEVQFSNPEDEAQAIVAAMKIQHAFRNFETRKKMAAAAQIQHRFRTWKIRKKFLNMRRQAIKIQAVFRGYQVRKQYRKIIWAFGVLEKAILRWRLKRKGFRGIQAPPVEDVKDQKQESDVEEGFFCASRKQAEERIERSVVKVQAMFRSKVAQQEYQKMKLAHNQAMLEYEGLLNPETDMG
ncbi:calmodulin-binding transcription activator 5-like isoform X6 [Cornus florida]|uniref:calmodulin-binding transcription activator 5-like isoform X6 n=1 Tax=Cornus florida TaxID=4283 RepID=UPI00289D5712|nr:calmodulin-binding transcription activator 5-like isoform X6 [Cornus florida]